MATTSRKKAASGKNTAKAGQEKRSKKNIAPVPEKEDFIVTEIIVLLSFALAVLLFLSNFHLCGAAGSFLRNLQLGIFGMVGFVAPLLLFVGICFYLSNQGNPVAMRKLAACIGVVLSLCGFAQMLFGRQPEPGTGFWEYFRLSAENGLGGGLTGGLICAALLSVLGNIGAFLILLVIFLICVVCITERSIVKAVKRHGDAAYQMAKEDMSRRRELHAEHQEERRRMREEKIRGVNLGSTDLFRPQNPGWEDEAEQYGEAGAFEKAGMYGEAGYDGFSENEAAGDGRNPAGQAVSLEEQQLMPQKTVQPARQEPVRPLSRADIFTGKITMPESYTDTGIDDDTAPFEEDEVLSPAESAQRLVAEGISSIDDFEGMFGRPATVPSFPSTAAEPSFQGLDEEEKSEEIIIPFRKANADKIADSESEHREAGRNGLAGKYGQDLRASYDEEQEGEIYLGDPKEEALAFESSGREKDWGQKSAYSGGNIYHDENGYSSESKGQEWHDSENGLVEEGSDNGENSYRGEGSYHDENSYRGENNYHGESGYRGESSYHDESGYRGENSYDNESSYHDENGHHDGNGYNDEGSYYHEDGYGYESSHDDEGGDGSESRYDEEGFSDEYCVPWGSRRLTTASGKVIESDTETLQKKLETKRQEAREGQMGDEAAFRARIKEKEKQPKKEYRFPPTSLMKPVSRVAGTSEQEYREIAIKLQQTLRNFGVGVTVTNISCGPSVTRYELHPDQGVKVSKIVGLTDDIKLSLAAADIRIEAPIPGKSAVGIEVPNKENTTVYLRELLESDAFRHHPSKLAFAVGKDIGGQVVVADIAKMPHLLIAGATGSGKSVCINTLIMSIIFKANPDDVKLIMVDPKVVELSVYNGIPHLLIPVVTDPKKASGALNWAVAEMDDRYKKFARYNVRNLAGYNAKVENIRDIEDEDKPQKLPQIVIIVDELADLMMVAPGEVEEAICRLAQLARAAGIHLVIATQRPSVNVITGLIKANVPSRIAFAVSSGVDSRTIIDMYGAEKLLGKGDMLFFPSGIPKPQRVQGAFVSDTEVQQIVEFLTEQGMGTEYNWEVEKQMSSAPSAGSGGSSNGRDEYFVQAGRSIIEKEKASIGMLQRMFKIGFNRAARIMDQLAEAGVVGEEEGTKPRKVLMTMKEFEEMMENDG